MEYPIITLLVVTVCIGLSQQAPARCLFSRLDYMPCRYQNNKLIRAGDNEYTIHYTRLVQSQSGGIQCNVRVKHQQNRTITNIGNENLRVIYSPRFIFEKNYDNQLLVEYKVNCGVNRLAFFNITTMELEGKETCIDEDGNEKCSDYILIERGTGGTTEVCGNTPGDNSMLQLQSGEFKVFFRTSEENTVKGFQMYIICFLPPSEADLEGCLRPEDFNRSVCNDVDSSGSSGSSGSGSGMKENDSIQENKRQVKRGAYAEGLTYSDIISEYPPGMKIRKDVANFHSQWLRQRRQAEEDIRFIERIVFYNESVDYTKDTIRIADTDNVETDSFEGVLLLQTFDAEGKISSFIGGVNSTVYPHFFGPGPLIIIGRIAFFQLFIIDPRGLIPNPEEERNLEELNRPLLASVNTSKDINFTDPNPIKEDFSFLFGERKKREVIEEDTQRRKRQNEPGEGFGNNTDEAVYLVLRNLDACNPVLRSQARSSLAYYLANETTRNDTEQRLNFTITCTSNTTTVVCIVDEGFAPALNLPHSTYCTFNFTNTTKEPLREQCNPFYGGVVLTAGIISITVESINCNGQRVKHVYMMGG